MVVATAVRLKVAVPEAQQRAPRKVLVVALLLVRRHLLALIVARIARIMVSAIFAE